MKDQESKRLIWKGLLICIFLFSLISNISSIVEIREGFEKSSYIIDKSFDYTPENIILYNYKAIFNNINNEKLGIEITSYYKHYDDIALNFKLNKDLGTFIKNKKDYKEIDAFFSNIFLPKDTLLTRVFKIYAWINTNIKYEISFDETQTPLSVFQSRKGDCLGYSQLMVYLLRKSHVPAKLFFSYLYNKKNNPAFKGISEDIFHSVIALYHPKYGWIAMEPQKIFLNITSKHILIFPEDTMPKTKIKYFEEEGGNKKFITQKDEDSYYSNIFLDRFIKSVKDSKYTYEKKYKIVGLAGILKDKGITSTNSIMKKYEMFPVILPHSKEVNKMYIYNRDTAQIMTIEFMKKGDMLKLTAQDGKSYYTIKNGDIGELFGLGNGRFTVYYLRSGLPFSYYSLLIKNNISKLELMDFNFILEKGYFKKVIVNFNDGSYMEIPHKKAGFIFMKPLVIEKSPLFLDFNKDYFYFFGMKKSDYTVKFYDDNNKKIKTLSFKANEK
ncbi:transglutaminase domain-containing protein [bacterium]|nr:transglutaminase domain-containing protein [bacterium]